MISRSANKIETLLRRLLLLALVASTFVACSKFENKGMAKEDVIAGSRSSQKVQGDRTALDEYIAKPDTNYSFHVVSTVPGKDQTTFIHFAVEMNCKL